MDRRAFVGLFLAVPAVVVASKIKPKKKQSIAERLEAEGFKPHREFQYDDHYNKDQVHLDAEDRLLYSEPH